MISLKEVVILTIFAIFLAGSSILTPEIAQRGQSDPDYDYGGDYVARIYELVNAANDYDTATIKDYLAEHVMIADFETGKFLVGVLTGLAQALNTEIEASDCEPDKKDHNIVSCHVVIMTDLHRAAGQPPAEGVVDVEFKGAEIQTVYDHGLIDESLDETSNVFRDWLKRYYPPQEAGIWDQNGYVQNFVGYIAWAVYWIRCQLHPDETPNCP